MKWKLDDNDDDTKEVILKVFTGVVLVIVVLIPLYYIYRWIVSFC
jgi:hypothetical protein